MGRNRSRRQEDAKYFLGGIGNDLLGCWACRWCRMRASKICSRDFSLKSTQSSWSWTQVSPTQPMSSSISQQMRNSEERRLGIPPSYCSLGRGVRGILLTLLTRLTARHSQTSIDPRCCCQPSTSCGRSSKLAGAVKHELDLLSPTAAGSALARTLTTPATGNAPKEADCQCSKLQVTGFNGSMDVTSMAAVPLKSTSARTPKFAGLTF